MMTNFTTEISLTETQFPKQNTEIENTFSQQREISQDFCTLFVKWSRFNSLAPGGFDYSLKLVNSFQQ